ncbi:hypothetical protein EI94DRAFT_1706553 [Lactarius quietus]|nr:hypothetical protein EI94DRAFT_1706553 [Lactarius quietus]
MARIRVLPASLGAQGGSGVLVPFPLRHFVILDPGYILLESAPGAPALERLRATFLLHLRHACDGLRDSRVPLIYISSVWAPTKRALRAVVFSRHRHMGNRTGTDARSGSFYTKMRFERSTPRRVSLARLECEYGLPVRLVCLVPRKFVFCLVFIDAVITVPAPNLRAPLLNKCHRRGGLVPSHVANACGANRFKFYITSEVRTTVLHRPYSNFTLRPGPPAHNQFALKVMTTNESLKFLNEEGEQHCGTRPYDGPDDDGVHLNGPWHLPHHPGDQYIRGSLETANSHLPIPYNDPLLSTTAGYSSLGHYIDHPNTLEGDLSGFSRGPSPSPLGDVGFPQMPGSSPESSSSANFQQSFFSRPHFPYGPYPSGQHHDSSRHESHYSPRASLTTESYGITEPIPEHSLLPIDDVFPNAAVSEHAYPAGMGAQNSGLTQDSMTAIPGSTTDSSTATVLIGDSTTYHQVFSGGVEGSAEGSLTGHGPPLPLSVSHPPPPSPPLIRLSPSPSLKMQGKHLPASSQRFKRAILKL